MEKKDEMYILCEVKHYIDCIFNSLEKLREKPNEETRVYLTGFIDYCKDRLKAYFKEYTKED